MRLTRSQLLLLLALVVVGLLTWFAPQQTEEDASVVEPAPRVRSATSDAPVPAGQGDIRHNDLAPEPRQPLDGRTRDLFKAASWVVPPPPPPQQQASAIPPPPPPPPQAPPLPFGFMGRYDDGVKPVYLLTRGDLVLTASVGEKLDGSYQVEALQGNALVINYLPLNQRQTLDVGASR